MTDLSASVANLLPKLNQYSISGALGRFEDPYYGQPLTQVEAFLRYRALLLANSQKQILNFCSTQSTLGDSTIIAASGADTQIVLTAISVQNESSSDTTAVLKNNQTPFFRAVMPQKGSRIDRIYPVDARYRLSANSPLILNLSGANAIGFSIDYYLEQIVLPLVAPGNLVIQLIP